MLSAEHKFRSQLPRGKQVFAERVVCTDSLGTKGHPCQGTAGILLRSGSQMPPPRLACLRERQACSGGASLRGALGGLLRL